MNVPTISITHLALSTGVVVGRYDERTAALAEARDAAKDFGKTVTVKTYTFTKPEWDNLTDGDLEFYFGTDSE